MRVRTEGRGRLRHFDGLPVVSFVKGPKTEGREGWMSSRQVTSSVMRVRTGGRGPRVEGRDPTFDLRSSIRSHLSLLYIMLLTPFLPILSHLTLS